MSASLVFNIALAVVFLGCKVSIDGYQLWNDWGALALSAFTFVIYNVYVDIQENIKGYHNVTLVLLENHTAGTVYLQWGKAMRGHFGYGEYIALEPGHSIGRRVQSRLSKNEERPCVRISQSRNNTDRNVTIILWDPNEYYHTKVYQIADEGVSESCNPTSRSWHTGDLSVYQSND